MKFHWKPFPRALAPWWEFAEKHPGAALLFTLLIAVSCAGGVYLLAAGDPELFGYFCFTGNCPK